jgi:hypothetical protein
LKDGRCCIDTFPQKQEASTQRLQSKKRSNSVAIYDKDIDVSAVSDSEFGTDEIFRPSEFTLSHLKNAALRVLSCSLYLRVIM